MKSHRVAEFPQGSESLKCHGAGGRIDRLETVRNAADDGKVVCCIRNRKSGDDPVQIEKTICAYLGIEKILWLGDGIVGDDTDGHVDDLTRFVGPRTSLPSSRQTRTMTIIRH